MPQGCAAAEHGERARERRRTLGQPGELALHGAGDLLGPERAQSGGHFVGRCDALGIQMTDQGAEQERVARGDGVAGMREARICSRKPLAHQRFGGGWAERARAQRVVRRGGEELRQQVGLPRRLARAHRAQDPEP